MKTLILWIDAVRQDYVNEKDMPFLYSLSKKYGLGELKQSFGFSSASFFTGVYQNKHGQLALYKKGKQKKSLLLKILPNFIKNYYFNLINYLKGNDLFMPYLDKKDFIPSQKKQFHHQDCLKVKTIFDSFRENKLKYLYYQWPLMVTNNKTKLSFRKNNDLTRVKKFIKIFKNNQDIYFFHLWDLDKYGHIYGPESKQLRLKLKEQDNLAKKILSLFNLEKDNLIIWSDHGMVNIKQTVNIQSILPKRSDYLYFLDGTMARFWFTNKEAKEAVFKSLNSIKCGYILSQEEKKKHKIDFKNEDNGEEIFLLDNSYAILPNFFNKDIIKGMHDYDLTDKNDLGIFIINKKTGKTANMVDMCPTILDILNIKYKDLDGKNLLIQ